MNTTDRDYFDTKLNHIEKKLQLVHDDVLVMKTERKQEKKFFAVIAGAAAFVVTTIINFLWR